MPAGAMVVGADDVDAEDSPPAGVVVLSVAVAGLVGDWVAAVSVAEAEAGASSANAVGAESSASGVMAAEATAVAMA
ncbi:hypothetical protein ABZ876_02965 [Streptomyces sp. NPDC046931]|uniref:hypothetical protein n=1 Tax=Streptomyces sp. NPDC046931 TaxID=3154806 RepID=UPI0033D315D1